MPARRRPSRLVDAFGEIQADYRASKRVSRFMRRRRGVPASGAAADWHYRHEADYLWIGESARDMDRNDIVVGQIIDRVVVDTIGSGFVPDPETGDAALDADLKQRWEAETVDPDFCDTAGELTFHEQEKIVLREMLVAGDIFAVPIADERGTVELREFHRCRSPRKNPKRNIVHGVELDPQTRKRLRYWFTRDNVDPHAPQNSLKMTDMVVVEARDEDGESNVWHIYRPKRPSQTRGITALAPIFEVAGMHDDLQFAQILKAQLASFFLLLRNRDRTFFETNQSEPRLGGANEYDDSIDDLRPGAQIRGAAGEIISGFTPNIPNAEFFPHVRLILTLLGVNLGLPLVLVLMDASETNFSGWRGAVDEARRGFQANQRTLALRFHRPYWRFKLNVWADGDPLLAAARERLQARYFQHRWQTTNWSYIEPVKDATADVIRDAHMLTSPRRRCQERGFEWQDIVLETIADRGEAIARAIEAAEKLNRQFNLEGTAEAVRWRDLAPLAVPQRMNVSLNANEPAGGVTTDERE